MSSNEESAHRTYGRVKIVTYGVGTAVMATVVGAVASFAATGNAAGQWYQIGTGVGLGLIALMLLVAIVGGEP